MRSFGCRLWRGTVRGVTALPLSTSAKRKPPLNPTTFAGDADKVVRFTFIERSSGDRIAVEGPVGRSVLDVAIDNNVDIEGACGGELACSTCHVIVSPALYSRLPKKEVEEDDMLDLAQGLCATSRLCCQIKVSNLIEGAEFVVPNDA